MDLPPWEVMYSPGNVSDYLIGYCNDLEPAKAAAEAWLRSQAADLGKLVWDRFPSSRRFAETWELSEMDDDGSWTDSGIVVRTVNETVEVSCPPKFDGAPHVAHFWQDDSGQVWCSGLGPFAS